MRTKTDVMAELRTMLRDLLEASASGAAYGRAARAQGCMDGYMRALLDLDVVSQTELLRLVASERERAGGPALRVIEVCQDGEGAVA
ncbi:MAG: hypothetical protein ACREJ3_07195 [Polyangiaceae bacterium]